MEPILVSFHAPIHDLDQVAKHVAKDGVPEKLEAWQAETGARELVYVATCQRVLWILWDGDPDKLGLGPDPVTYKGDAAWRHLLGLAAGLESANVGDREITGQLTDGLTTAQACGVAGAEAAACLDEIIREALRLRTQVGLADGQASVATVALRHIEQAMNPGDRIALVGVGPMSRYLAQRLPERGFKVALANRTVQKAKDLALEIDPEHPVDVVSLASLQKDPVGFEAIVTATAAAEPIFTLEAWGALEGKRPMVRMIDLALPADSEPALEQLPWVHRVDLHVFLSETASAKRQRAEAAQDAAPHLLQAVARVRRRAAARNRKRRLNEAQETLNAAWEALEKESLGGALGELSEEQAEAIRQLMRRGRTLAHRALIQGQPPEGALEEVAKILQLGAS